MLDVPYHNDSTFKKFTPEHNHKVAALIAWRFTAASVDESKVTWIYQDELGHAQQEIGGEVLLLKPATKVTNFSVSLHSLPLWQHALDTL